MKVNRRRFLKIAGLATLGLAAKPAFDMLSGLNLIKASPIAGTLVGARWAMVVNLKACLEKDGGIECIDACHRVHNVPDFDNPKDKIKWIWTVPYEDAFRGEQEHEFIKEDLKGRPAIVLCNHCDNPPCVTVCPTGAFEVDPFTRLVNFDNEKCIACELCIKACPSRAMGVHF